MNNSVRKIFRIAFPVLAAVLVAACYDEDEYFVDKQTPKDDEIFDFSTKRNVDLIVDYSDYQLYGPVRFSIYSENPIVNENEYNEYIDESIEPIFEAYTNERGLFDDTITLPSYASVLHVTTGNFMIGLTRKMVQVVDGQAKVKLSLEPSSSPATRSLVTRATGPGESTNDLSSFPWLSYNFTAGSTVNNPIINTSARIYNDWNTPLGTWNSATGRPDYLMTSSAPAELQFPQEEVEGLYAAACEALSSGKSCQEEYRFAPDMTLLKDSEVSIVALGGRTCWNSSLGYFYYSGENPPQSTLDLNIVMLFPNTQDGMRYTPYFGDQYQNNIGVVRGDAVQLKYYPNIASGDLSTVSTTFPKGTKIGFILKPNGWTYQGAQYCTKNNKTPMNKLMNIWSVSTQGLSYCNQDIEPYNHPNTEGVSKTAKFSFISDAGHKYALFSVEDACDDEDYDDLLFALNPANAFSALPLVAEGMATIRGVYAFEDRWPYLADYDMNDVMVNYEQDQVFKSGNVKTQIFRLTTYQNYVSDLSGLAVRFNFKTKPSTIVMKKILPGSDEVVNCSFTKDAEAYYLTDDVKANLGTTYIFEVTYGSPQKLSNLAEIEPFIYRDEDDRRWEVHLPNEAPTSNMDMSYFGTGDDKSNPAEGKYYVCQGDYPFAFYLSNAKIEYFQNTTLKPENESKPMGNFFPQFLEWSTSKGKRNADWYLHPSR